MIIVYPKIFEICKFKCKICPNLFDGFWKVWGTALKEKILPELKESERQQRIQEGVINTATTMGILLGEMMANQEITFKQFGKKILQLLLSTIRAQIRLYYPVITANQVASKGFAGIVTAGLLITGIEAAFMAAQTAIPKFYKGTKNAPAGLLSVGEQGRELIETKTGQLLMANKPMLISGIEGAKINLSKAKIQVRDYFLQKFILNAVNNE